MGARLYLQAGQTGYLSSTPPPVVSLAAGASELIEDGFNGFRIKDATDALGVAGKLDALLVDDEMRMRMSLRARETASKFGGERVAKPNSIVYRKVLRE